LLSTLVDITTRYTNGTKEHLSFSFVSFVFFVVK
jgi:hypothetical protein